MNKKIILCLILVTLASALCVIALNSEQTQYYWKCLDQDGCINFLKNKQYTPYRTCALNCSAKAAQYIPVQMWCKDSDGGADYLTKGVVTTDLNSIGVEDYCYTFNKNTPQEKTYLMEGSCFNNKYSYIQKNCGELGNYVCEFGACVNSCEQKTNWYEDQDNDGYGSDVTIESCSKPKGYVDISGDCEDNNINAYPSAEEVCDNVDNDCDGKVDTITMAASVNDPNWDKAFQLELNNLAETLMWDYEFIDGKFVFYGNKKYLLIWENPDEDIITVAANLPPLNKCICNEKLPCEDCGLTQITHQPHEMIESITSVGGGISITYNEDLLECEFLRYLVLDQLKSTLSSQWFGTSSYVNYGYYCFGAPGLDCFKICMGLPGFLWPDDNCMLCHKTPWPGHYPDKLSISFNNAIKDYNVCGLD